MLKLRHSPHRSLIWSHLWLGLTAGVFFLLMGASGGVLALRPQISKWFFPPPVATQTCVSPINWNRAEQQVETFTGSRVDAIYFPGCGDRLVHFRMMSGQNKIYKHTIYDECAAQVVGAAKLGWMDWLVDFHHNLREGRAGRAFAGAIAIAMLASGVGGLLLWTLSGAKVRGLLRGPSGRSRAGTVLYLHRVVGLTAGCLLILASFTALWLCVPQTVHWMSSEFSPKVFASTSLHAAPSPTSARARLGSLISAAERAIPGGTIREIRMPEGSGPVQVRMWLPGDFSSLGNNTVKLDSSSARVLSVNLYSAQLTGTRFGEVMADLHRCEWGGLWFRWFCAAAGLLTPLLAITGFLKWWFSRHRKFPARSRPRQQIGAG